MLPEGPAADNVLASLLQRLASSYPYGGDERERQSPLEPEGHEVPLRRGVLIAVAAFVPTFLAVFLGVSLLSSVIPSQPLQKPETQAASLTFSVATDAPPTPASPSPTALLTSLASSLCAEGEPNDHPPAPSNVAETVDVGPSADRVVSPASPPRVASPRRIPIYSERSSVTPVKERLLAPAAAFGDYEAARRLAVTIREQGYRVEVRHENSTDNRWAVWVGKPPSGKDSGQGRAAVKGSE